MDLQTAPSPAQRLLLGDWGPVVRDGLDLLRAGLVLSAVAMLALRGLDGGTGMLAFTAAVAVAIRPLLLPRLYDLFFLVALALQGVGEASGAYDSLEWFDRVVHFVVPMLGSGVVYIALARLDVLPDPRDDTSTRHHVGIAIVTFALGGALGAVWELVEFFSDGVFGSALQESNADTVGDLGMDCLGALAGAGMLVLWTVRGWGSVRRVPGSVVEAHD